MDQLKTFIPGIMKMSGIAHNLPFEKLTLDVNGRVTDIHNRRGATWDELRDKIGKWAKHQEYKALDFKGAVQVVTEWLDDVSKLRKKGSASNKPGHKGTGDMGSTPGMGSEGPGNMGGMGSMSSSGGTGAAMGSDMDGGGGGGGDVLALPSSFTRYMQKFKVDMVAAVANSVSQNIEQAAVTQMLEENNDEVMDKAVHEYLDKLSEDDRDKLEQKCIDELKEDDDIREKAVEELKDECEEDLKAEAMESMIQDGTDIAAYLLEHGDDDDILEAAREIKRRRKAAR